MNLQTLQFYWRHLRTYWQLVLVTILGLLASIAIDLGSPLLYKRMFNILVTDLSMRSNPTVLRTLYWTVAGILVLNVLSSLFRFVYMHSLNTFETSTIADLYNSCFSYLHRHSVQFFADSFVGGLVKYVDRFANGFETIADQATFQLGQMLIRSILIIAILFWQNPKIASLLSIWSVFFVWYTYRKSLKRETLDKIRRNAETNVSSHIADTVSNNLNLKAFAGIDDETRTFKHLTELHKEAQLQVWQYNTYTDRIQTLAVRILDGIVIVSCIHYWKLGLLTLGDFVLLRSYMSQLVDNTQNIGQSIQKISISMSSAKDMTEILVKPHDISDPPTGEELVVTSGMIELRDVTFAYGTKRPVLRDFNLIIEAGESIGIVGPSGGGKSTLLKLINRLYDVRHGKVFIDKQDISTVTQDSLHRAIAYVPQEPQLFHRSIMENIRYSRRDATDEEVIAAAKLAHCHDFIVQTSGGYHTPVGERGIKLSGGERQRVAIARAILMDAPILLLDEATSSLDSESELLIQRALDRLMRNRTVIAVAHRLSTVRKMDRIIVVQDGGITEEGSHDVLLKAENGIYQKLWGLQSSREDDTAVEWAFSSSRCVR